MLIIIFYLIVANIVYVLKMQNKNRKTILLNLQFHLNVLYTSSDIMPQKCPLHIFPEKEASPFKNSFDREKVLKRIIEGSSTYIERCSVMIG
jgi:hypothetical protein